MCFIACFFCTNLTLPVGVANLKPKFSSKYRASLMLHIVPHLVCFFSMSFWFKHTVYTGGTYNNCMHVEVAKYVDNLGVVQLFHWGPLLQHLGPEGSAPLVKALLEVLVKALLQVLV